MIISCILHPDLMRGLWYHHRCRFWNVYVGRKDKPTIEARCRFCGQRSTFKSTSRSRRGRKSKASFHKRPDHMPKHALNKEARSRNSGIPHDAILHWRKLGEIVEKYSFTSPNSISAKQGKPELWTFVKKGGD